MDSKPRLMTGYFLECLHRAGFTVSAHNDKVMLSPESEVCDALRTEVEHHHVPLLQMLRAAEDVERIRRNATKGANGKESV